MNEIEDALWDLAKINSPERMDEEYQRIRKMGILRYFDLVFNLKRIAMREKAEIEKSRNLASNTD